MRLTVALISLGACALAACAETAPPRLGYAPPEVLDGSPATPLSDVYSLAAVLYAGASIAEVFCEDVPHAALEAVEARCLGLVPVTADALRSLWHYQAMSYRFHTGEYLSKQDHPYQSEAIGWLTERLAP